MMLILIPFLILGAFVTIAVGSGTNDLAAVCAPLAMLILGALYIWPTVCAVVRHRENVPQIVILNVFLGWSLVGWVAALVWAYSPNRYEPAA